MSEKMVQSAVKMGWHLANLSKHIIDLETENERLGKLYEELRDVLGERK